MLAGSQVNNRNNKKHATTGASHVKLPAAAAPWHVLLTIAAATDQQQDR